MSSIIDTLEFVSKQLNRWFAISILIVGIVGSVLNFILFTRRTLYKHSCSIYFLSTSLVNLAMFLFGLLTRILNNGFQVQTTIDTSSIYCKIRNYLVYTLFSISSWLLVLASFDRLFSTHQSISKRQWICSHRMAAKLITLTIVLCGLAHMHMLIFFDFTLQLNVYNRQAITCTTVTPAYTIVYAFFILVFYSLFPPILMIIFGVLTLKNIHRSRQQIYPLSHGAMSRRASYQLLKILLIQIFFIVLFTTPHSCYWLYIAFTTSINSTQTNLTLEIKNFLSNIVRLLLYVNYSSTFYLQVMFSKTFRNEFIKIFKKIKRQMRVAHLELGRPSRRNILAGSRDTVTTRRNRETQL